MSSSDFVKSVLAGFADALQPIKDAVASPDAFSSFLKQFGWTLTSPQLTSVINVLHEITTLANNPSSLSLDQLTHDLVAAATTVRQIATSGAPQAFVSTFPRELLDFLVYSALASNVPPLFGILRFAGILSEQRVPANAGTGRDTYIARQVHWDQLGPLANSPLQTIEAAYGWGGTFDADSLLRGIAMLAGGMGARAGMYVPPRQLVAEYFAPQSPGVSKIRSAVISVPGLDQTLVAAGAQGVIKIAVLGMPIAPNATTPAAADGVAILPVITGKATELDQLDG